MGEVININTIEQLKQFLNENGFMEVAIRNKNKTFAKIQKVCVDGLMKNELQNNEVLENIVNAINKNNAGN